ncbi:hypothetical protein Syun_001716 [Stephania yunnanensis]|uniref:Uncharacterized protein n=1 Tax=Stephania yunnanensis TaxID=152371 RepID=A0AAP0LEN4_9MAGN
MRVTCYRVTLEWSMGVQLLLLGIEMVSQLGTPPIAEDGMNTSFPGGPTTLDLLPSFRHHVFWHTTKKNAPPVHEMDFYLVWEEWEDHLIARERRGDRTVFPWQSTPGYLQWFESVRHQFAESPEHVTGVDDEDEATLRNYRALDVALQFRSMPRTNVTTKNAIAMEDAVIAFLYGVEEEEEDMVTDITTHSDGATTSTTTAMAP